MPCNSSMVASLQSEYPANRMSWQYLFASGQVTSLPLSLPAHISPVDGSTQYSRTSACCFTSRPCGDSCAQAHTANVNNRPKNILARHFIGHAPGRHLKDWT